ncbi:ABC transporter ATP-binding protein/permease [Microvirga sp. W0021]|uniref:ABC transporter ATP-binding protein/permease n=1 Tax=Hohaiivirga grylli TaxID=3133970 RepID=A0ABV0BKE6_9HYPH
MAFSTAMDKSLFKYIWQHSKREQLLICAVVLLSLPFYYLSLDLPRRIVNEAIQGGAFKHGNETVPFLAISFDLPTWLGGAHINLFDGLTVGRIELLLGLSLSFLFFVLINGAFKYWINLAKGALGERMLRRMRFELFNLVLRFSPEYLKQAKSAETATIIKDEVEPIGGFIGDAFILPMFLGAQAATALMFIILQSTWLGLMAAGIVLIQIIIIPRLRRKLLVLGRKRQLVSRRFAGRIGEVFDGQQAVRLHNTEDWERADIGDRLYSLFDIRYRIYKRKFVVKFLNNLLAQMTPFLFYAIGGYFAVTGRMDIGQLVAVIAAYRDLPPPLKELIDWDQQRLDVQVKYDQVVQQFAPEHLLPEPVSTISLDAKIEFGSPLKIDDLSISDAQSLPILSKISFDVPLHQRIAVTGQSLQTSAFVDALSQPEQLAIGSIMAGNVELTSLPRAIRARKIGCVNADPILFPGTIRDNLVYGLKARQIKDGEETERLKIKRQTEARKTGNPLVKADDEWVDYELAGVSSSEELDRILLEQLHAIGMGEDIYRFGQYQSFDPERYPNFADRLIKARELLYQRLEQDQNTHLVEFFDCEKYNTQATIAENVLFGVPTKNSLQGAGLAEDDGFRKVLRKEKLFDTLVDLGANIAETMVELFRDLPPGHPLFEQFSFVSADELEEYATIVQHWNNRRRNVNNAARTQLIGLALNYIEPRHRFGLLDETLKERLVQTRVAFRETLEESGSNSIEFYDRNEICSAAPLRDNILFGKINLVIADAQRLVANAIHIVIEELELRHPVERLGLNHQVGVSGRLLTAQQRVGVDLVRNLVKRPEILIVDRAFSAFASPQQEILRAFLQQKSKEFNATLIMVITEQSGLSGFDFVVNLSTNEAHVEAVPYATQLDNVAPLIAG